MMKLKNFPSPTLRWPWLLGAMALSPAAQADPQLTSWFTEHSGQYARLYESSATERTGQSATTWSRGRGHQSLPAYAGVHEITASENWVYIRTTGLASHVMGPWYLDAAKTRAFPNFPSNTATTYRIPRHPEVLTSKSPTSLGAIGYLVNGVALFDSRDSFSYSSARSTDATPVNGIRGDGIWNRDAWVNEGVTMDAAAAHQAGNLYHYHANSPGLRHQLGDSVAYDAENNVYSEAFNGRHSPILGWAADGFPIYGPYGYDDASDPQSPIRRMISGYQKRDGSGGSVDLRIAGRTTLPLWAADFQGRAQALTAQTFGPQVSSEYVLGHYLEDYAYRGNLGGTQGIDFDLDPHNGRYGITPEYPEGTYAYFLTIEADGTPVFPYSVGREYHGDPKGGSVTEITESVITHFQGGPAREEKIQRMERDASGTVTMVWSAVEGATYTIEASSDLQEWQAITRSARPDGDQLALRDEGILSAKTEQFYRVQRTGLEPYDDSGSLDNPISGEGASIDPTGPGENTPVGDVPPTPLPGNTFFVARFPATPPLPPQDVIESVTIGGLPAQILGYDQPLGQATLSFALDALRPGNHVAELQFTPPGRASMRLQSANAYTVLP